MEKGNYGYSIFICGDYGDKIPVGIATDYNKLLDILNKLNKIGRFQDTDLESEIEEQFNDEDCCVLNFNIRDIFKLDSKYINCNCIEIYKTKLNNIVDELINIKRDTEVKYVLSFFSMGQGETKVKECNDINEVKESIDGLKDYIKYTDSNVIRSVDNWYKNDIDTQLMLNYIPLVKSPADDFDYICVSKTEV